VATILVLGLLSLVTSFANGVLGAGGAILFIPVALYALPLAGVRLEPHPVTALSLVQGICAFAAGGLVYGRRGQVAYRQLWLSGPALGLGGFAGGYLSGAASARLLVLLFALLTTAAAALLLVPPPGTHRHRRGEQAAAAVLMAVVGALGGAVGVGAGVLVIPVLLYVLGTPPRTASGTGLVLPAFISGPAFAGKALTGQVPWGLVPAVAVLAVAGATIGSRVTLAVSPVALRLALSALTGALALVVWAQLLTGPR
jgi:uncharacterized membrane protein YfcA